MTPRPSTARARQQLSRHSLLLLLIGVMPPVTSSCVGPAFLTTSRSRRLAAFAAGGGFGSSKPKKKMGTKKKKSKQKSPSEPNQSSTSLATPQDRMEHIRHSIQVADVSSVAQLTLQTTSCTHDNQEQLVLDVNPNGMAVVDNFLGREFIAAMRAQAESLLPTMVPSQSTKWDESTQSVVSYEKVGVLSTQIQGGEQGYQASPLLVEYIVTLTKHLTEKLNQILPDNHKLSVVEQTNKLAVCLGDGSYYDKHIDNLGGGSTARDGGDRRKLTALLYLQPPNSHQGQPNYPHESVQDDARGGYFRAYDVLDKDQVCIAPRGDRLVLFWSDALVHDVSASFAPAGESDRRWALTVWLMAAESATIRTTDTATEERHFGTG